MEYRGFVLGDLMANCYVVWSGKEAGVIDPGGPVDEIVQYIYTQGLTLRWILNTHGHADHIAGNEALQRKFGIPIVIHQADRPMLTSPAKNMSAFIGEGFASPDAGRSVKNGDRLQLSQEELLVIETPGHTPGSISLYTAGLLFSGDTLFFESIGRTDFPGGDSRQIIKSIKERLFTLPPPTIVLPGHASETSIEHEQKYNPFLWE